MVQFLMERKVPAILAMPIRGKKGGLRRHCRGKKSRIIMYQSKGEHIQVAILCNYRKGRSGRNGVDYHAYALVCTRLLPAVIRTKYRKRFGIETSYRIVNQSRAWTTSPSQDIRTLYFIMALILQNVWVNLKWSYFRDRRQGVRETAGVFTFEDFLDLIEEGIKWLLGRKTSIPLHNWVPGGLLS